MAGPLSHIRVLDLSRIMAGPWAGQVLADLGADVIKVERPGVGDDTRAWGPPFLKDQSGKPTGEAGYYLSVNRGKRSIALELDKPEGQEVVRAIAARSDIVLENFKAGTLKRFGLDYEGLKAVNPNIIYCSITGFGQTGPKRDAAAYDFMIQAMGGLMSVTGERDGMPGAGPQKVGVPIVDLMTGMYAAVGVLAALARRNETGQGDYIDLAMLDVQSAFLANQAMNWLVSGNTPEARRQPPSQYPAAGCLSVRRRLCRAGGRQRRPVRQARRNPGPRGMGQGRAFRHEPVARPQSSAARPAAARRVRQAHPRRTDRLAGRRGRAVLSDQHGAGGLCRAAGSASPDAARAAASDRGPCAAGRQSAQFRQCIARLRPFAAAARRAHRRNPSRAWAWHRQA